MCLAAPCALTKVAADVPETSATASVETPTPLSEEWPSLPRAALEGVKSRKKQVLKFQFGSGSLSLDAPDAKERKTASNPSLTLASRVAIAVSSREVDNLMAMLTTPTENPEVSLSVWRHDGLRVAALDGLGDVKEELRSVAELKPHVIAVHAGALLKGGIGLSTALVGFSGALLILLDQEDTLKVSKSLKVFGIDSIWSSGVEDVSSPLACVPIPAPKLGTVLGDIKVKKLQQDPVYRSLSEAAQPVYEHYFQSGLVEDMSQWDDVLVAFLVDDSETPQLLGFIVYKFFPAPLRSASIIRVAVLAGQQGNGYGKQLVQWFVEKARRMPRHSCNSVSLTAVASAVTFYERLNFVQAPVDEQAGETDNTDPDSTRMHYALGRAYVPPRKR